MAQQTTLTTVGIRIKYVPLTQQIVFSIKSYPQHCPHVVTPLSFFLLLRNMRKLQIIVGKINSNICIRNLHYNCYTIWVIIM